MEGKKQDKAKPDARPLYFILYAVSAVCLPHNAKTDDEWTSLPTVPISAY